MKRISTIDLLLQDLHDDFQFFRLKEGFWIDFLRTHDKHMVFQTFAQGEGDDIVGFLFDISLTHYIDGYVPYGCGDGKTSSYDIFLKECNKRRKVTNITPEVIEAFKRILWKGVGIRT